MSTEKVLGYSIEVRGTDEQRKKQEDLRKSILDLTNEIKKHKDATADDIDKQKNFADVLAGLENNLKANQEAYNKVNKEIRTNAIVVTAAAGSYDELVQQNNALIKQLHAMPDALNPANKAARNLEQTIFKNTQTLKDFDAGTNRHFRSVGNYTGGILTATKGLKGFAEVGNLAARAFGIQTEQIEILVGATRGLVQGVKGLKEMHHASTLAKQAETAATGELAAAETAALGPIGLMLAAATAIGAAIWYMVAGKKEDAKAIKEQSDEIKKYIKLIQEETEVERLRREMLNGEESDIRDVKAGQDELNKSLQEEFDKLIERLDLEEELSRSKKGGLDDLNRELNLLKAVGTDKDAIAKKEQEIMSIELANLQKRADALIGDFQLQKEISDKKNAIQAVQLKRQAEIDKQIDENNKKIWELTIKNLDKAITEANALYVKDGDAFLREQDRKNKAAVLFWNKILMDAVKLAGDATEIEQARYLQELDLLKEQLNKKEITQLQYNAALEIIEGTHKKNIADIDKKANDELVKNREKMNALLLDSALDNAHKIEDAVFASQQAALDRQNKMRTDALDAQNTLESKKIDDQLQAGTISQMQADQRRTALAAEFAKKKLEQQKKEFEDEKKLKLKQIIISMAVAIAEIWAKQIASKGLIGIPFALAQTGIVVASSAVETGIIASQKFARGGIADGPGTETSDSIPVRVSKNEAIINANSTRMFRPWLSAMNEAGGGRGFFQGGIPLPTGTSNPLASLPSMGMDMELFAEKIVSGINDKKVFVSERDISGAQNKRAIVESTNRF